MTFASQVHNVVMRKPLKRLERGLPGAWYRDPAHHERELAAFWRSRWIAACREEELSAPGDWRKVNIGSQSIVLARGEDGKARAFHNVCRHRGSVLCTAEDGHFERKRIVCPYHSWTYDLRGKLVATPRRMETPEFDMARFPLHEVAVDSWGGFVFVRLEGKQKFDLGTLPETLKNYRINDLRIGKRIVADIKANWKLLAENFSECFHCPPVHPELCRVVTAYRDAGAWGLRGGETTPEYKAGAKTLTLDGSARIPPINGLSKAERETLYVPWMLPPNLFLNIQPDYVNSHLMFPTGPESVRIVYDWLFEPANMPKGADLEHYTALWEITNKQDAQNCEWQQQGLQSLAFDHGWYVPQEFDCHRFAQWVRAGLKASGASGRARSARK
jgi:Rieske 2Fe-2S family protein